MATHVKPEPTTPDSNQPEPRYCGYCGKKMRVWPSHADEEFYFYGFEITIPLGSRYDAKTGKENFVWKYECPDYKNRKWYQLGQKLHDQVILDKVFNF